MESVKAVHLSGCFFLLVTHKNYNDTFINLFNTANLIIFSFTSSFYFLLPLPPL